MYGRPSLGKENLAGLAGGLERSCIRPVDAVGRPLALIGYAGRVPSNAARFGGAMTKRSVPIQVLTILPSLLGAPCGCLASGVGRGCGAIALFDRRHHSFVPA